MITIETMSPQRCTEVLRSFGMKISVSTVRDGIRQRVFPFGDCIETGKGNPVYIIYTRLFIDWLGERTVEHEDED